MERTDILEELNYNRSKIERRRIASRAGIEAYKLSLFLQEVAKDLSILYSETVTEDINVNNTYGNIHTNISSLLLRVNLINKRIESLIRSTNND